MTRSTPHWRRMPGLLAMFAILFAGMIGIAQPARAAGSISLTLAAYIQNFDTLVGSGPSSTVPNGWDFAESGTSANTTYAAGTGSNNAGNTYSFGAATSGERAFGTLQSSSLIPTIGASFTNNTVATITDLAIAYTGEQWRLGAAGRADRLDFQISTNATSLTTGTWVDQNSLDFSSPKTITPTGALDGNLAANRIAISATITTSLNIPNGATFWIRWADFNAFDSDDGLAVDEFSLTPAANNTAPSGAGAANPSTVLAGNTTLLTVAVTPGANPSSTSISVTGDLSSIGGSATQAFFDDGTHGDLTTGDNTFSFQATVAAGSSLGPKSLPISIGDAQLRSTTATLNLTVFDPALVTHIHDIQGAAHSSPNNGLAVSNVLGIVTAKRSNGFYIQESAPDSDDATSEGLFVFTSAAPTVSVGDEVVVGGTVTEFRADGSSGTNLTVTEISAPTISVLSSGNALPTPIVIGSGGRVPPTTAIEDDSISDVETSGVFDPASDGIDFYESLEAMRVQVNDAVVVGPTNSFGEIWVLADNGANASVRTTRAGIVVRSNDFNPERIQIDDEIITSEPQVNVGDSISSAIVGVLDYSFGNFELLNTAPLTAISSGLTREVTTLTGGNDQLTVATFNVENLDPGDGATKFAELAGVIVNNLKAPDLVALEEIQDNNGPTNDGTVDATTTYNTLIAAITAAGGPTYQFRQIDPLNGQDGGEPGGNIRLGFLFRVDRGLNFTDRPGGTALAATTVISSGVDTRLAFSPGRIDPTNIAFNNSRKPLAGEFVFNGHKLFVIANHFNSKGGDQPLYGRSQPPARSSETQRHQQAQIVHDFVQSILAVDPGAAVVVLGDLNDFEFSDTLTTLSAGVLHTLIATLPQSERYTYVFEGNSQALDHILLSNYLKIRPFAYDIVHVNSEFVSQVSDHDPQVVRLSFGDVLISLPLVRR